MFYEETTIDGIVYFRNTPDGKWRVKQAQEFVDPLVASFSALTLQQRVCFLSRLCVNCAHAKTLCTCPE